MSTNILAWVLSNMCRDPTPIHEVISCFEIVRNEIVSLCKDLGFTGSSEDVVRRAVSQIFHLLSMAHFIGRLIYFLVFWEEFFSIMIRPYHLQ